MKQYKEEEELKHIPAPTLKEGNPTRVMLSDLTTLNIVESRNQRKILLEMAKIGGGTPKQNGKKN